MDLHLITFLDSPVFLLLHFTKKYIHRYAQCKISALNKKILIISAR